MKDLRIGAAFILLFLLMNLAHSQNSDSIKFLELHNLAVEAESTDQSKVYAEEALQFSIDKKYLKGVTESAVFLGSIYAKEGAFEEGIAFFQDLIPKFNFDGLALSSFYNLIGIYHVYMGHYDSTEKYFIKALEYRVSIKDSIGIGTTLNNLGNVNLSKSELIKATDYYTQALEMRETINDSSGIASSTNNLGLVFYKRKMFDEAIKYYKRALELNHLMKNESKGVLIANNLGNAFDEMGAYETSFPYYRDALAAAEKLQDARLIAISSTNLGVAEMRRENFEESERLLGKALELRISSEDLQGQAEIMNELACMNMMRSRPTEAIKFFNRSNLISLEIDAKEITRENFSGISDAYSQIGDFKNAYIHQSKYIQLKDSILNEQNQNSINELITKYDTEKKEQQIALQQSQLDQQRAEIEKNEIIQIALISGLVLFLIIGFLSRKSMLLKRQKLLEEEKTKTRDAQIEAAISSQEQERKRFARDLHDGFGQMISVLNLNLKSLEKGESDREEVFQNSSKVLDDMYKELKGICFNLMPETLIKNGVVDAIKEFGNRVNLTGKLILEVDTFGITERLNDLQEISIYRITQEWVNNILKYSDADKVTVSLTKDEEEITLLIEDNGSGFDKQKLIEGTGNGWKNMNSRANLIKGELELDSTPLIKGNTLILNLPVSILVNTKKPLVEIPS